MATLYPPLGPVRLEIVASKYRIDPPLIARQSTWQGRVKQDGKGSRGVWIMPLMVVAGKHYVEG
jgi:hypothetical protein